MPKTEHNLLTIASDYVQQIAREYPERSPFAYEQVFDDQLVKLTHLYQDDVDICFVFDVSGITVEIYCNWGQTVPTGHVWVDDCREAECLLRDYFDIVAAELELGSNETVWFMGAQEEMAQ